MSANYVGTLFGVLFRIWFWLNKLPHWDIIPTPKTHTYNVITQPDGECHSMDAFVNAFCIKCTLVSRDLQQLHTLMTLLWIQTLFTNKVTWHMANVSKAKRTLEAGKTWGL